MTTVDEIMKEIAEYTRLQEEVMVTLDELKDTVKQYMVAHDLDTLAGTEHKATYKAVTSTRIDTTALKAALPDVAAQYTKTTASKRFTFS